MSSIVFKSGNKSSIETQSTRQASRQSKLNICSQSFVIQKLKENTSKNILRKQEEQYIQPSQNYCVEPSDLLRWIAAGLDQRNQKDTKGIRAMVAEINKPPSEDIEQTIIRQILSEENYLGSIMRKGFIHYLFRKYETHNYTDNSSFIHRFTKDLNWFKEYFTNNILSIYSRWLEKTMDDSRKYFERKGIVEMLTQCEEWQVIYAVFNKCLGKQTCELRKEDMKKYFEQMIEEYRTEAVPFSKSIQILQEFCQEHRIQKKTNSLRKLSKLLEKEGRTKSDLDERTKLKCLEYCIFMSEKESLKSVIYFEVLYGAENINSLQELADIKFQLKSLKNATYTLLSTQTLHCYDRFFTPSPRRIQFKHPILHSMAHLPCQVLSIRDEEVFTTLNNSKLTLFSVQPLVVGSSIKLQFSPGAQNNLSIGVCHRSAISERRKLLQNCESAIVLNTRSKIVYQRCIPSKQNIEGRIYRITLRIKNSEEVEWVVNEDRNNKCIVSVTRRYRDIANSQNELHACVSFRSRTSFSIIEH